MAYFVDSNGNSKKVGAILKSIPQNPIYKHSVKMTGTYDGHSITIYADLYTTSNVNYAASRFSWDDCMDDWEGVIAGNIDGNKVQYLTCVGSIGLYQTDVYEDITDVGTTTYTTIDMAVMNFITDVVTQIS